jgi:hypothetical protein
MPRIFPCFKILKSFLPSEQVGIGVLYSIVILINFILEFCENFSFKSKEAYLEFIFRNFFHTYLYSF